MFTNFSWIHIEVLLQGLVWTVLLSIIAFIFGGLLGFAVALAGIAKNKALVALVDGYTVLVQGTPVLILMFIVYFGLPVFGIEVSSLFAASVAMTIFASAFLGAIWRGSLQSVPRTQWEASDCLALTGLQGLFFVIMPQAIRINATNSRLHGPDRQEHVARIDHRHGRDDLYRQGNQRFDVPALHDLSRDRILLLLHLLPALSGQPEIREDVQCQPSLSLLMFIKAMARCQCSEVSISKLRRDRLLL